MYVEKVYGDKAYDNRRNFNILGDIDAEPAISIRKNASTRSKGCPLRRDEVLLIKKLGYEGWKQLKVANRGEWLPHKWNVRKGYLKIHVAVDIKKKRIVSLDVTSGGA